ncbi:MAG: TRAP transporter fused permease subunit [Caenispirillum bisanense]|nr:TRAP transporter fused permease subunit [Caenispirillum bisanense]MCA1971489.1 TRAP transporter fused permease subunit [Caenispirillum sp.]
MIDTTEAGGVPDGAPLSRPLSRITAREWLMLALGVGSVAFHLYLVFSGLVPALVARPIHFMLAIPWVFFLARVERAWLRRLGYGLGVAGLAAAGYVVASREALIDQYGALQGPLQMVVAATLIVVVLEMARRAVKAVLPVITLIVLVYGLWGHLVPGDFGHGYLPPSYFLGTLVIAEGGLWSSLTGISAETIAPFIILGAFISAGAAGIGFMALATQAAGRFRAGAAKVAVLASAMYGTISGVAAANTASTGMVTIPAMKRLGYPPAMAAATEAVASTGGQIMPPLMGAGIFVMAELLRTDYATIMTAASPSALLFFATVWFGVHMFALRWGLKGLSASELPGWPVVLRTLPFFLAPFGTLVYMLAFTGYTAPYAAALATGLTAVMLLADSLGRVRLKRWLHRLWTACVDAGRQVAAIAAIIICASIIVGVFGMTGLGVKVTSLILSASGGNLWLALILTGLAALVLGMELPTTAAYIIAVAVAGPALTELGLPELYAHLFVFWYALLCTITPPVCGNVFIAAGIAETPWLPVAWRSMQLGIGLFLVPLGFVANPSLLLLGEAPWLAVAAAAKVGAGTWLISYGAINPHRKGWAALALAILGGAVIFVGGI